MRKRDQFKSISPFIFTTLWLGIFYHLDITAAEGYAVPVVSTFILLVGGSIMVTDCMLDLFDKNDNEEDEL